MAEAIQDECTSKHLRQRAERMKLHLVQLQELLDQMKVTCDAARCPKFAALSLLLPARSRTRKTTPRTTEAATRYALRARSQPLCGLLP
eukprot:689757-Rhodomonas_salina.2